MNAIASTSMSRGTDAAKVAESHPRQRGSGGDSFDAVMRRQSSAEPSESAPKPESAGPRAERPKSDAPRQDAEKPPAEAEPAEPRAARSAPDSPGADAKTPPPEADSAESRAGGQHVDRAQVAVPVEEAVDTGEAVVGEASSLRNGSRPAPESAALPSAHGLGSADPRRQLAGPVQGASSAGTEVDGSRAAGAEEIGLDPMEIGSGNERHLSAARTTTSAAGIESGLDAARGRSAPASGDAPARTVAEVSESLRGQGESIEVRETLSAGQEGQRPASLRELASLAASGARASSIMSEAVRPEGLAAASSGTPEAGYRPVGSDYSGTLTLQIAKPAGQPGWGDEFGERVIWLVGRGQRLAELRLNPPELGSLEIKIRQQDDGTSVSFVVQSAGAREAVEMALPRLRELFNEAGLTLQRFDVAERQTGEQRRGDGERAGADGQGLPQGQAADDATARRTLRSGEGLVDAYA